MISFQDSSNINYKLSSSIIKAQKVNKKKQGLNFIDLFAGIGGLRLGFAQKVDKCVFSSEWDKNSQKTYFTNFGEVPHGDITQIEAKNIPNHDVLLAGFPCQAFSIAGYRKGFEDTRGTLFFDIARILEYHKPKAFILENVKNLQSHQQGNTFKRMLKILEEDLGYQVFYKILNPVNYANVPQNRERIFIVGFHPEKVNKYQNFKFPEEEKLTKTIRDLIEKEEQSSKYYYQETHKYYPKLKEAMNSWETVYQWRRVYVRENKSNVCPTLTANMGTGGHNVPIILDNFGIRKLTPRECANFQGFPQTFKFPELSNSKLYYQIGNSVTVPLVERISFQVRQVLNQ